MTLESRTIADNTFWVGITLKGIDGALETIGGVRLWLIHPSAINAIVSVLSKNEFSHRPQVLTAFHTLYASEALWNSHRRFASLDLLSHGVTKVILVIALWMNSLRAYPLTIFVFGGFSVYQIYRYSYTHSVAMLLLTAFDLAVIYLTSLQWREQKALHANRYPRRAIWQSLLRTSLIAQCVFAANVQSRLDLSRRAYTLKVPSENCVWLQAVLLQPSVPYAE